MKNKHFCFSYTDRVVRLLSCVLVSMMMLSVASCEEMNADDLSEAGDKEAPNVVVRVASFEQVPFPAGTRAAVGEVSTRLNVAVYDETGLRVKQVNQKEGDAGFGQVGFLLPAGHYYLVALAHNSSKNPTMTNAQKIRFSNQSEGIGYSDTFLYGDSLVVGDEPIERVLSLRRIVAKVRFELDDAPPPSVNRIRFAYEGGSGTVDATTGWGVVKSKQKEFCDVVSDVRQYEIYTIPREDSQYLTVTVEGYQQTDSCMAVLTERQIDSIPITRNRITVCHGNLFSREASATRSSSFSFTVENEWEEGQIIFF